MKVSRAQAAENRKRIVSEASRLFRERGLDGVGVDGLMKAVGLTHGGFYGHFRSKDDLIAEAVACGLDEGEQSQIGQASLNEFLTGYLTPAHRSRRGEGCLVAALGGDLARQAPGARSAITRYIGGQVSRIAKLVSGRSAEVRRKRAIAAMAGAVGALVLARAVDDEALSDEILAATREVLGSALATSAQRSGLDDAGAAR